MKTKWYRVRIRTKTGYADEYSFNTLEDAYEFIKFYGRNEHPSKKYYIDEVNAKLFSAVTVGVVRKRLDEIRKEKENVNTK